MRLNVNDIDDAIRQIADQSEIGPDEDIVIVLPDGVQIKGIVSDTDDISNGKLPDLNTANTIPVPAIQPHMDRLLRGEGVFLTSIGARNPVTRRWSRLKPRP